MLLRNLTRRGKIYLTTGLLILLPVITTIWITTFIFQFLNQLIIHWIPYKYVATYTPVWYTHNLHVSGITIFFAILGVFIIGFLMHNAFGDIIARMLYRSMKWVPFFGRIYMILSHIFNALLTKDENKVKKVVLIEFPSKGTWTIGFVTNECIIINKKKYVAIMAPTAPNPTSGFLLYLDPTEHRIIHISLTQEEAITVIFSAGTIDPTTITEERNKLPDHHECDNHSKSTEKKNINKCADMHK